MAGTDTSGEARDKPAEPSSILNEVSALADFLFLFLSARLDEAKLTLRRVAVRVVVGLVLGLLGVTLTVVAGAYLVSGLSGGLAAAMGDRVWLGRLSAGVLVLGLLGGGFWIMEVVAARKRKQKYVEKYESRKLEQRIRFGRDIEDEAGRKTA